MKMPNVIAGTAQPQFVQVQTTFVSSNQTFPANAKAGFRLNSDGNEEKVEGIQTTPYSVVGPWLLIGAVGDYEARYDTSGPTLPTGSLVNAWVPLSTTQFWEQIEPDQGVKNSIGTLTIRRVDNQLVVYIGALGIFAEVTT